MYLSHAVRTIRDDPMAEESVDLVVTLEADTELSETFDDEVTAIGGEVVADLQFSAVHVRLPETAVADLCALDGIDRIETAETLRLVGDEATEPASDTERPATDERETDTTRPTDRNREQ
ncbi:hypothetical protein [Salinirubrum litoreum]|uniref:Putative peptidase inhibitor domain-containing protein n=1 Tax=Salinirubrum litoreum TaxID=1126234 RepID=A0ABD5RAQ1_9EURY|nr:hypothetical protein [Salinirubrum litoreum]